MVKEKISRFHAYDYLETEEDAIFYLKLALAEDTPEGFIKSLQTLIKSKGFTKIAEKMSVSREGLYKSFSGKSKPKFETIYKAIDSLGFRFDIVPKEA
jgi:probable addiction module antidote protein